MFPAMLARIGEEEVAIVAVVGALTVAALAIVFGVVRSIMVSRHREESRREIAAYVAEGSISPDDAVKLLATGKGPCRF